MWKLDNPPNDWRHIAEEPHHFSAVEPHLDDNDDAGDDDDDGVEEIGVNDSFDLDLDHIIQGIDDVVLEDESTKQALELDCSTSIMSPIHSIDDQEEEEDEDEDDEADQTCDEGSSTYSGHGGPYAEDPHFVLEYEEDIHKHYKLLEVSAQPGEWSRGD